MKPPTQGNWRTLALIAFVVGMLFLALGGYLQPLSRLVLQPTLPIQEWAYSRFQFILNIINTPTDINLLRQQNADLVQENAELQTQIISLQQEVNEVEILSALLDFARAQPSNDYQAAAVIGRDPSPFLQYIIINRGSDDNLRRGMPVVSAQGLVGRVAAVTANAARVELITDPISSVNVQIGPEKINGVLAGSITSDLFIDLIPQDATLTQGSLVLSSGLGGNYPANILIGQITSVSGEATNLFQQASLEPVTDFDKLEIVLVIINFKPIDITPLIPTEE